MAKSRSVGHLLENPTSGLSQVINRAKALRKLTTQLKNMVDTPLCDHIYVANIRGTTLIIGTDSAAWHTRIKYLAPMILEQMRQLPDMDRLQKIEFRVQPFSAGVANTQTQQTSAASAQNNESTDEDSPGQRLEQLSRKIRGKKT
ncbi:DciA family protein [Kaarinaea lacus]